MAKKKCSKCSGLGWFLFYYGLNPESDPQRILCKHDDDFNESNVNVMESSTVITQGNEILDPIVQLS